MTSDWLYVPCSTPSTGPSRWCRQAAAVLGILDPGGRSLGCYNRRSVDGDPHTWSVHACGRALDWHPASRDRGYAIAEFVVAHAEPDVQLVIWRGQQWGGRRGPGWRRYTGANQHIDHIHIESRFASSHAPHAAELG